MLAVMLCCIVDQSVYAIIKYMQIAQFINSIPAIESAPLNQLNDLLLRFRQSYRKFTDLNQLNHALTRMAMFIARTKELDASRLQLAQECLYDIIDYTVGSAFQVGAQALRYIFDSGNQFYRTNHIDKSFQHPIGEDRCIPSYEPEVGEDCDVVKPYITSTSYCGWTRCTVLTKQTNSYTVLYLNTNSPVTLKDKPHFAPLAERTSDFDWRLSLDIGSRVDAIDGKNVWYASTVVEMGVENGCKRVRVSYRIFDERGDRADGQGNRYFGLGPNQDQWMDITSPRMQPLGKMHKQLCYFASVCNEYIVDDTYDLIFEKQYREKPFPAIMRLSYTRSLAYLNLYKKFCDVGGHKMFVESLHNTELNVDSAFHVMVVIGACFTLVPRMRLGEQFEREVNQVIMFAKRYAKAINNQRYDMLMFYVDSLCKRLYSFSQRQEVLASIRRELVVALLKQNLEKQLVAIRVLQYLYKPVKPFTEHQAQCFYDYLKENKIFYMVYQVGVHESILNKSIDLLRFLVDFKVVSESQMEYLWNLVPQTDLRGRAILEKMLADLSKTIPISFVENFLAKIINLKETDLTIDNLNLLRELKNREDLSIESRLNLCTYLWDCISVKSMNIKHHIEQQIEKVFKGLINTLKDGNIRANLLKAMCQRLSEAKTVRNEIALMKDYILTYPTSIKNDERQHSPNTPTTISEVVHYLREENIYSTLLNLLNECKSVEKKNVVLDFLGFLFQYDGDDLSEIVRTIYHKIGPSDIFMNWAKTIYHRTSAFFSEIFETHDVTLFENLTESAFESIKLILLDINLIEGNTKVLHTKSVSISTDTDQKIIGPMPQQQSKTFIYTLKSPFVIKGFSFLEELLFVVKNSKVYQQIVKLIIQLIVSLDQSIQSQALHIRRQFCHRLVQQIKSIQQQNVFNDSVKVKLETYISFIQQLFSETEKNGLSSVIPHFETIQGQIITLKIENLFEKDSKNREIIFEINENATISTFKIKLSQLLSIPASSIDIFKYKNPMSEAHNGKSVGEMFFTNESIKIDKKPVKEIPKHQLLNNDNSDLSQKFKLIVTSWFQKYKNENGNMGIEELKRLSGECWKGSLLRQHNKLTEMLKKNDVGQKGHLTFLEFKNFFVQKSLENPAAIWKIINLSGYLNNLKHKSEPQKQIDVSMYPRKILSNTQFYQTIFTLLSNPTFQPIHFNFYRLLSMVETDTMLKEQLRSSEKLLVNLSRYSLSYAIEIIMSLISEQGEYYFEFYRMEGLKYIIQVLKKIVGQNNSLYTLDNLYKLFILPNLIWIVNVYQFPIFSDHHIIKFLNNVKINLLQLDEISSKLTDFKKNLEKDSDIYYYKRQSLKQINVTVNWKQVNEIGEFILMNLVINYNNEFLLRLTNESAKLASCISIGNDLDLQKLIIGLKSQSLNLRRTAQNIIYLNLCQYPSKNIDFLNHMLNNIPSQTKYLYTNFFGLLSKTIEQSIDLNPNDDHFIRLALLLIERIYAYPMSEVRNVPSSDKVLLGLLINLNILVDRKQAVCRALAHKKHQLIEKCLFFYGASQKIKTMEVTPQQLKTQKQSYHFDPYVKCKHEDTRKILYTIIAKLHKFSHQQDTHFFSKYILPVIQQIRQPRKSGHRSTAVGLNNLGSTCYLNSMIQVLNSIGPFRNTLMMMQLDSSLVNELKQLFSYLFFSERVDYVPYKLLASFNPPINPALQQDTTQFLNYLFDQLEIHIRNSPYSNILEQIFRGSQVGEMICHGCGGRRERKESFFSYSVEIEGKYQLKAALEGMHQGEVINDCLCQSCGKRCDTTKRNVLNEVPNIFFLHLKRIVFNYDVFVNTKIHTRLQFPNQLNFEPYTKEGLSLRQNLGVQYLKSLKDNEEEAKKFQQLTLHGKPKDSYVLKLKAVIVHSGTAQVGHYYTILNKEGGWVKFDDSRIGIFSASNFESECYGGTFQSDEWGGFGSSVNAYVLVYEKVVKEPIRFKINEQERLIPYHQFVIENSPEMYKQVWLDNHQLMLEDHLLSDTFSKDFLSFVVNILQNSPNENKVHLLSLILYKISVYSTQVGELEQLFLNNIHQIEPCTLSQFILSDTKKTFNILFHYDKKIRDFMSKYVGTVLMYNYFHYPQTRKDIFKFLDEFYFLLHTEVSKNWLRCDGYFRLLNHVVVTSVDEPQLYQYVLSKNFISVYIDFIMQKASPINISHKKYSLGSKTNPLNFSSALNSISFLLRRSFGFNGVNYEVPVIANAFHLSNNDVVCLSYMAFYEKMLRERQNLECLAAIIQRLCIQNIPFSEAISRVLLKCINEITDCKDQMKDLLYCICQILIIRDEHWVARAQFILGYSTPYIFESNLLTSIDEQRFVYSSTLDDLFPVECLLAYAHINRNRNPLAVTYILSTILKGCSVSQQSMTYLCRQVSPTYIHARYIDWIAPFLANVLSFLNLDNSRKEQLQKQIDTAQLYLKDLQSFIESHPSLFHTPLIAGQLTKKEVSNHIVHDGVEVIVRDVEVYSLNSLPNGVGNHSLDSYLNHGRLTKKVRPQSSILYFFKQVKPPLSLTVKPVQQSEDKIIMGLFDQDIQPKGESMEIEQPTLSVEPQPTKEKETIDQEVMLVNVEGVNTNVYFKQFELINKSDVSKAVTIYFDQQSYANSLLPSKASFVVTHKSSQLMWLFKQNPSLEWGKIIFNIKVENNVKNKTPPLMWFKQYGELESSPSISSMQQLEQKQNQQKNQPQSEGGNLQGDIQCPSCTLLNPPGTKQCDVCGYEFPCV